MFYTDKSNGQSKGEILSKRKPNTRPHGQQKENSMKKQTWKAAILAAAIAMICVATMSSSLYADTINWTGGGTTSSIGDPDNWGGVAPGPGDRANIINTGDAPATVPDTATTYSNLLVGVGASAEVVQTQGTVIVPYQHALTIGSGIGNIGRYTITHGTLACTGDNPADNSAFVGAGGGKGYLDIGGDAYVNFRKLCLGTNKSGSTKPRGYVTVRDNGILRCRSDMWLGNTDNDYSEINQSGGIVTTTNAWVYAGSHGAFKYIQSGGRFIVNGQVYLGRNSGSSGTFEQSGGEVVVSEDIAVGGYYNNKASVTGVGRYSISGTGNTRILRDFFVGTGTGSTGTVNVDGGSLSATRYVHIGAYGTGTFNQSGGSVTCNNWTAIGRRSTGVGTYNMTGGTFNLTAARLNVGEEGVGTLDVSGTAVMTVPSISIGANTAGSKGSVIVRDGGKIVTGYLRKGSGTVTLVRFDGGIVRAQQADAEFFKELGNIALDDGGLALETAGYNLGLSTCVFNVVPGGKITVTGGGTVTFTSCTASLTAKPSKKFVFAETDGVFSGMPTFTNTRGWKVKMSADNKKISIVPPGMMLIVK